ncbi:MAG: ferrous iron transport protein B [Bdellovibrionales bacterium]|nr:ferrous iron transport protein B [Bdellovibrionales bacterium]
MSKSDYLILIGPPNSGKTTLFNWITGYKKQTVNYPGSTVDLSFGLVRQKKAISSWTLVDTPGVYSLSSPSSEGEVTKNILKEAIKNKNLRGIVLVLDATRLKRQMVFAFQLKELGLPVILALSMYDIQKQESPFDLSTLSKQLGIPVCPIEGLLGGGVFQLLDAASIHFKDRPMFPASARTRFENSGFKELAAKRKKPKSTKKLAPMKTGITSYGHKISSLPSDILFSTWSKKKQEEYLKKAKKIVDKVSIQKATDKIGKRTRKVDSWLLHPVFGFVFLSLILFTFFSGIFWIAQPFMHFIDSSFSWGADKILNLGENRFIWNFIANGVLTGFGAFLVFVPQVFILFLGLYLLEDSGYLSRAVTLVDGPFSRIGLSGKSLFPFLSAFACAIPATLSARSISSKRERWITIFVLPFMTCSARLPVYALLLGFLFYESSAWKPGLIMSLIYLLSLLLGILASGILNIFLKSDKSSSFLMELPLYRRPVLFSVFLSSWSRTKHFIRKAGPVIFTFTLIMWITTHFPRYPDLRPEEQIQKSYAGQFGQMIEPVFKHIGGDWRVGVSLLSAFVAREVFVPVLAVTLKNTEFEESTGKAFQSPLTETMQKARLADGRPLFSTASILALLVFFMLSLQCLSTTGIAYKETGSWRFAAFQLISFNVLAYMGAVLSYILLS